MLESAVSVLLVEDNRLIAFQVSQNLEALGFHVKAVSSGDEAIESVNANRPDLILMDINLNSGKDGIEVIREIHGQHGFIPNIYLTGYSKDELLSRVKGTAPLAILEKPVSKTDLERKLKEFIDNL